MQKPSSSTLPFSERRWLLVILDFLLLNGSLLVTLALRPNIEVQAHIFLEHPSWFLLLNLLWFPIAAAFDVYELQIAGDFWEATGAVAKAELATIILYLLIPYLSPSLPDRRLHLLLNVIIPLLGLLLVRWGYVWLLGRVESKQRVLIYGAGWAGTDLA